MERIVKNLTQKNEELAMQSAHELIDAANIDAFEKLCEKSDFLFDFIKANVCKRLYKAANSENYKNVIKFFNIYDETYCEVFAQILKKFGDENLKFELLELLKNGNDNQKAYCAKCFEINPFTAANEILNKEAFSDFLYLSENSIKALAASQDNSGIKTAYNKIESKDGFEVLKGIKFLTLYPDLSQLDKMVYASVNSSMPENTAEEIANAVDMEDFIINNQTPDRLLMLNSIINGMGEIISLSRFIDYKVFNIARALINQIYEEENSQVSQVLLNLYSKCKLFLENDEYTYDEDIDTKNEIKQLMVLFTNQGETFWNEQKTVMLGELKQNDKRIAAALQLIKELNYEEAANEIVLVTQNPNEMIVCLAVELLAQFKKLELINIDEIEQKISNPHILAIIKNYADS